MISISRSILISIICIVVAPLHAVELNADTYANLKSTKGVVVVAVNWGRQWQCGDYENAQLVKLEFLNSENNEALMLKTPSKLLVNPEFINYGYVVEPGTYAISAFSVKVAKSTADVGYIKADKNKLVPNGAPKGGTFDIKAGEVAYIGHFFIDCYKEPIPWRYYPEGKEAFNAYVDSIKKQYTFLQDADISFNILNTSIFGNPYELH